MRSLKEQLNEYSAYHQSKANQFTHYLSIPAIILGILILLSWISITIAGLWHISFAWIAVIGALIYYFRLNIKLAALMTIIFVILTLICSAIAYPQPTKATFIVFIILFVGGWILQLVGHTFEKKPFEYFISFNQILIAPLYLLVKILTRLNLEKYFDLEDKSTPTNNSKDN